MKPIDRLRLAAAVAHGVPGAQLRLTTRSGAELLVSRTCGADLDPCTFRRMVAACGQPPQPTVAEYIVDTSLGGSICDTGGGIFASRSGLREQRWVATLLPGGDVASALSMLDDFGAPHDAICARVTPDSCLGVTLVAITAADSRYFSMLDETAAHLAATCFVGELCSEISHSQDTTNNVGGLS